MHVVRALGLARQVHIGCDHRSGPNVCCAGFWFLAMVSRRSPEAAVTPAMQPAKYDMLNDRACAKIALHISAPRAPTPTPAYLVY